MCNYDVIIKLEFQVGLARFTHILFASLTETPQWDPPWNPLGSDSLTDKCVTDSHRADTLTDKSMTDTLTHIALYTYIFLYIWLTQLMK